MDRYTGWVVRSIEPKTLSDPPQDMPNIDWYKASDVADLARRGLEMMRFLRSKVYITFEDNFQKYVNLEAELEQIAQDKQ